MDSYTRWHRAAETAARRDDMAASLEEAAKLVRETPRLNPIGNTLFLYATDGTPDERRAVIDGFAREHHVTAGEGAHGYYAAKVRLGELDVLAVALPAREDQDAPVRDDRLVAA